ncbi:PP2C-domain-containing protein [Piedraia hortae CBS 480.64]|uniref:Adenylate cyclase n=1 Tax=Piedraia hortae CBS 480.64 TaxID=1314780 RepID=A0A6A7C5P8_9PEZI|nr:PP2C-domain-containing protein [Piedraia hortae CBS 480.64]
MSRLEGIVDQRAPMSVAGQSTASERNPSLPQHSDNGMWDAPDSWAVRKMTESKPEDSNSPGDVDPGRNYYVRIFRADSTFAVICAALNTTAAELIVMMAKKTYLQDDLDHYQLVMRMQNSSRQLAPGERPLVIQKKLLELAGYQPNDGLDDLGREDHGYLCRFTFMTSRLGGFSSLERDPAFNKLQQFTHVDLSKRDLITIPITLYQKATEIIALNLSRNLTLDVPKDFIQSCTTLHEIRYASNEARKVPVSITEASNLTTLDLSNNRLQDLDQDALWKLAELISLKLSNNKLSSIPMYFGQFRNLRSLNISSNGLTEFPKALKDVQTLVDVDVSFNAITKIEGVGMLTKLERLWATNNRLSGPLDESFSQLASLREIDARFNSITNISVVSDMPCLEMIMMGHNSISQFVGSFARLKYLFLNHNPVTSFDLSAPAPTLTTMNIASAKLSQLPDSLFSKLSGLKRLTLAKNHFVNLSPQLGQARQLEYLSVAKNDLNRLPAELGKLSELKYLDVRENNLESLPREIWHAKQLETLNVSSNVLTGFPKPGPPPPQPSSQTLVPGISRSPSFDELGKLEDYQLRRPSQASSSPSTMSRKGSVASSRTNIVGSAASTTGTITPTSRKDSMLSSRLASTFASSLKHLFLADNRLDADVFGELVLLPELRVLNLSYNNLLDVPPRTIRRWPHLTELYLSGNDLTSLPSEDLDEGSSLKVLHINNNKFQTLPAELGKVPKLAILDVGNNTLKYNVSNWPYDWNWNWNHQLRYLNMSGNKRLEIKPSQHGMAGRDLADFTGLLNLRMLGLMDVTLTIPSVPDQGPDRRVRTVGSTIGTAMPYGMADTLGRNEHLSTLDLVVPRFRGHESDTLIGLFDGESLPSGGSRIAKYLHDQFKVYFGDELDRLKGDDTPADALRRTYLAMNKELATVASQAIDAREHPSSALVHRGNLSGPTLEDEDLHSGCVATVMYLHKMQLYMSNVGDAQAILIHSEGGHRLVTRKHDPAETSERTRIREAGGFVSRQGKLNDVLPVSRAFGYVQQIPCVCAAPHVSRVDLQPGDEMILLASRELWEYLTFDFAVDVARSERHDLMQAAQKLRDLAIAFGATDKIMVMLVGVADLQKGQQQATKTGNNEDYFNVYRKPRKGRDAPNDSKLARLDQEVEAPTGNVTLVFTDIKSSTILWETYPVAMQSAIKMHNEVMRRHLRIIGGYEVKTEGDAFMVAFPSCTSALLWCFTIQSQLLHVPWPQEILNSVHGEEMSDADGNTIFRGLSVRMGIHWGRPVCEIDPVTKRMDYFGPMVNRAARIESVADGGQICVSADFIQEIQRMMVNNDEAEPFDAEAEDPTVAGVKREIRSLSSQGFEVKDLGQRTLKGLENPEYIFLMYPHALAGRLVVQQQKAEAETRASSQDERLNALNRLAIDTEDVWDLWSVSLRLEMLCSTLESTGITNLKPPETAMLERMKQRGGEVTDRFMINFVEHQISRIESCTTTLSVRNMVRPFRDGMLDQAGPMADILTELASQLAELKAIRADMDFPVAPA